MNSLPATTLTLANGLRATLVHDPDASRAAAVLRIARGSHDEPEAHPGLAHFIEHLLFLGGERFVDGERLMPWVQARGGQVTANQDGSELWVTAHPSYLLRLRDEAKEQQERLFQADIAAVAERLADLQG